jgi:23S rRNA (guanosine2251-2'-O)-methyltransferase
MSRIVYGKRPAAEALRHAADRVQHVWLDQDRREALADVVALADGAGLKVEWAPKRTLEQHAESPGHQGAVVQLRDFDYVSVKEFLTRRFDRGRVVVALDGVTDPQNFGACLRAAGAFGADLVITTKRRGCPVTPVVTKVSAGGTEVVPVARENNLAATLKSLKKEGFWVYGLDAEGTTLLGELDLSGDLVIVLGSEGEGLHRIVAETCDGLARIPAPGPLDSLNVAQACAVALYEATRARLT